MIHLFIWRGPLSGWDHWKSLPRDIGLEHMKYISRLGLQVEYVGF